jgi:hypothetical protein
MPERAITIDRGFFHQLSKKQVCTVFKKNSAAPKSCRGRMKYKKKDRNDLTLAKFY